MTVPTIAVCTTRRISNTLTDHVRSGHFLDEDARSSCTGGSETRPLRTRGTLGRATALSARTSRHSHSRTAQLSMEAEFCDALRS